jgi:hypothetical protein
MKDKRKPFKRVKGGYLANGDLKMPPATQPRKRKNKYLP